MFRMATASSFARFVAVAFAFTAVTPVAGDATTDALTQLGLSPAQVQQAQAYLAAQSSPSPTTPTSPTSPMSCSPISGASSSPATPTNTTTCLPTDTDGPINKQLGTPIQNGIFTFYGAGGRGACGLDTDQPAMSAAVSGDLFNPSAKWMESCLPDKRSLLDDPICKGICVKIDYNGKSLTVPANNKCPECKPDHVDLSVAAFNYLEPKGGEVGIAKNATITYQKCDGSEASGGGAPSC